MPAQPPSRVMIESATVAGKTDPSITASRVKTWIDERKYIHRPPKPLTADYINCLLEMSQLTANTAPGKSIEVVPSLFFRGYLPFFSHDRLRKDLKAVFEREEKKLTSIMDPYGDDPEESAAWAAVKAAESEIANARDRDNPARVELHRQRRAVIQDHTPIRGTNRSRWPIDNHPNKEVRLRANALMFAHGYPLGETGAKEAAGDYADATGSTLADLEETEYTSISTLRRKRLFDVIDTEQLNEVLRTARCRMKSVMETFELSGRRPKLEECERIAVMSAFLMHSLQLPVHIREYREGLTAEAIGLGMDPAYFESETMLHSLPNQMHVLVSRTRA